MKQVVQNYKRGTLSIVEVPEPRLRPNGLLVQTHHSLISAGTEKMKVDDSKRSYLGMAMARPDKVKQVINTYRQLGPLATYRKVMNRLDSLTPLGYSLAGRVMTIGEGVSGLEVGELVACGGGELATHAEINWIPENLCGKIPKVDKGVEGDRDGYLPTEQAAFATVGAIAMQGVRQAQVQIGENVAVIGLGLVGLLACQLLRAAGCRVLGYDIDPRKVQFALDTGLDDASAVGEVDAEQYAMSFTNGQGMDAVIVTTGTKSNEPIVTAGLIARDRATIVDVGINKMDIPWQLYYAKELVLKQSRSYGPGRYDEEYELRGRDYPIGYVRWTEKRNIESFLQLMASGKVDVRSLITHRVDFENATAAYENISGNKSGFHVGIVLEYDVSDSNIARSRVSAVHLAKRKAPGAVKLGVIGAGNFARTMLLPHLDVKTVELVGVATATGITARDTARKFNFGMCTTNYEELLESDQINTILIATRHDLHGKLVAEALEADKHVYTEKPLCINKEELNHIASIYQHKCESTNPLLLIVGFNRRFAKMVTETKKFFVGRKEPMILHYRVNAGFMAKDSWYQDPSVGGGRIIGEVCHFIDTMQYLTSALPVSVFARNVATENKRITRDDNICVSMAFSDGSIGSITYLANGDPAFPKEYLEVFCEGRVAVMDNFSSLTTMARGKKKVTRARVQDKGHKAEIKALIDAVRGAEDTPISFESIHATTLTSFKILESLRKGQEVLIQ